MRKEAKLFSKKKTSINQRSTTSADTSRPRDRYRRSSARSTGRTSTRSFFSPADKDTPPDKKTPWNCIKHCKKDPIGVGTLRDNTSGELLTEPRRKAELLNDQFQSVFSRNTPLMLKHLCQQATRLLPAREISVETAPHHARLYDIQRWHQQASQEPQAQQSRQSWQNPSTGTAGTPRGDRTHPGSHIHSIPRHRKTTRQLEVGQRGPHIQKRIETSTSQLPASLHDLHMLQTNGTHRGQLDC